MPSKRPYNSSATKKLGSCILNLPYFIPGDKAVLVRSLSHFLNLLEEGANPNVAVEGYTLLELLVVNNESGTFDWVIDKLIHQYDADLATINMKALVKLNRYNQAMKYLRLGANIELKGLAKRIENIQTMADYILSSLFSYGMYMKDVSYENMIKELIVEFDADPTFILRRQHLKVLLSRSTRSDFNKMLKLISFGADPNIHGDGSAQPLLHQILRARYNDPHSYTRNYINTLVSEYGAQIDISDSHGHTPLQALMCTNFNMEYDKEIVMQLMSLGADTKKKAYFRPVNSNTIKQNHLSILEILQSLIAEPIDDELAKINNPLKKKQDRAFYLLVLYYLANDYHNHQSQSLFKMLPKEMIFHILTFLNTPEMEKDNSECEHLAKFIFLTPPAELKQMANHPGGMNVFQAQDENSARPKFTFFKSVRAYCDDYLKVKDNKSANRIHTILNNNNTKSLHRFQKDDAIAYWQQHSSLFSKFEEKVKLFNSIRNREPFVKKGIYNKIKFK